MPAPTITTIREALGTITSLLEQPLWIALAYAQPEYAPDSPLPDLLERHLDTSLHDFMTWLVIHGEGEMDLLETYFKVCNPFKIIFDLYFMETES